MSPFDPAQGPPAGPAPDVPLQGLGDGYAHYLEDSPYPGPVDWDDSVVVLDTNVLLDLYRTPDTTRDELLDALEGIQGSLFMPAQVRREFWRNRDDVLRENAAVDKVGATLQKSLKEAEASLTNAGKVRIGTDAANVLIATVKTTLDDVKKQAGRRSSFDWRLALKTPARDTVLQRLLMLYAGKVGPDYDQPALTVAVAEAAARATRRFPPGYMDAHKDTHEEKGAGDYLLWHQTLAYARTHQKDVVLVTRDSKEDWWRLDAGDDPMNARHELLVEMRREAGVGFRLLRTVDFVRLLGDQPESPVSERSVQDVGDLDGADESRAVDTGAIWTPAMYQAVRGRLTENGYDDRANVLGAALDADGGTLSRSEVLDLLGRPQNGKLTGFTRAVTTATAQLVDEGVIPQASAPALWADYDGPGKAVSFSTPQAWAVGSHGTATPEPTQDIDARDG